VSQQRVVLSPFCDVTVDPSGPSCKYLLSLGNVLEPVFPFDMVLHWYWHDCWPCFEISVFLYCCHHLLPKYT